MYTTTDLGRAVDHAMENSEVRRDTETALQIASMDAARDIMIYMAQTPNWTAEGLAALIYQAQRNAREL